MDLLNAGLEPDYRPISPLESVSHPLLNNRGLSLYLKRDDLIPGILSGNKFRKLLWNLREMKRLGCTGILTPGGAWSNHLLAVSRAGAACGFRTTALVRGENPKQLSPVLEECLGNGMKIRWLDRSEYRNRDNPSAIAGWLRSCDVGTWWVPEGGSNIHGVLGARSIPQEIQTPFDYLCLPSGTGGTLAGCIAGCARRAYTIGFPVMKGGEFLYKPVNNWLEKLGITNTGWHLDTRFHFGGYAKSTTELDYFISEISDRLGFQPDKVYNAKALFGLFTLIREGHFPPGTRIVYIVTQSGIQKPA